MGSQTYLNKNIDIVVLPIREYDMSEAGFSLIKEYSLLSNKIINNLENNFTKQERTIEIGKLMNKYKNLSNDLMISFKKARKLFIESNNLKDEDILSIKKDALFIIKKRCNNITFGKNIKFTLKNKYTSYYHIGNNEFYYSSKDNKLDVKGITVESPLFDEFKKIFKCYEYNKSGTFKMLQDLRLKYLNKEFNIEYYRELNSQNSFRLNYTFGRQRIYMKELEDMSLINIEFNYVNFILPLIQIMI